MIRNNFQFRWIFLSLGMLLAACTSSLPTASPNPPLPSRTAIQTAGFPDATPGGTVISVTASPTAHPPTSTLTATETARPTATITVAPTETITETAAPTATFTKLRGEVIIDQAVCHYGPGAPYLYKYGVYKGSNLEIIARDEPGVYVEIQAIGGNNPCWVKAEYLDIKGSLESLELIPAEEVPLPWSPYYAPPSAVSARRDGNQVTVFWSPLQLRPGDDSEQVPYVIEAWVCQNGKVTFTPLGAYETALKITDEAGCIEPSHGRLLAAEKHGYTRPLIIPWPPANATMTPVP